MKEIVKELYKRKLIKDKLLTYGFIDNKNKLTYECMLDNDFKLIVEYDTVLKREVIDINTNDPYIIIDLNTELGRYASSIKDKVDEIIKDIINKCSVKDEYISDQTKRIIKYIEKTYKGKVEHPWEDDNVVIRHQSNKKWYLLLMTIDKNKLIQEDGKAEVINLKCNNIDIVDNNTIFNAYHMNKKSWISIILDDRLADEIIYSLIDSSYLLTK
jgi:predicted DNA-binding protein (MmcQ/YjbR family)